MRCDDALELILDADLEALAGLGSSPIAMHLRECGRCRSIASQLLADTRVLAASVQSKLEITRGQQTSTLASSGMRRAPGWRSLLAGSLAAAAIAIVVMEPGDRNVAPSTRMVRPEMTEAHNLSATPPAPASVAARSASPGAGTRIVEQASQSLAASEPQPFPRAEPVIATHFAAIPSVNEMPGTQPQAVVSVSPPPGTRVAVMQTSDPELTVVWLY